MSNQTEEQLELVKRSLEANLEEMKKVREAYLAMRELEECVDDDKRI